MISRSYILDKTKEYYRENNIEKKFIKGETYIPVSGKVVDEDDLHNLIDASLDMWLTAGTKICRIFRCKILLFSKLGIFCEFSCIFCINIL